jgi:hypothetical protein
MFTPVKHLAVAAAIACISLPAGAQNAEPEEARTTYQITYVNLAPGADERWMEILSDHTNPARQAAGLPLPTVHWLVGGPWQLMLVTEMPDGMAALDSHNPRVAAAYRAALLQREGSEAAADALDKEMDGLVEDSERLFSHTHP